MEMIERSRSSAHVMWRMVLFAWFWLLLWLYICPAFFVINKIKIDSKSKQIKITCTFTFHVVVGGGERSRSGGQHVTLFQFILTSSTILYWISFIFVTLFFVSFYSSAQGQHKTTACIMFNHWLN